MSHPPKQGALWAIVLAAGEGTRLSSVTAAVHGAPVPKQYAAIAGPRTFIQRTMDRIAPLVPLERTVVVIADGHRSYAEAQLAGYPGIEIVGQPRNRGTGTGLLLPLLHVLRRDPEARVVVFPSDHHVERESAFVEAVERALRAAGRARAGVALVGAAAEAPATDLGWIACGAPSAASCRPVKRFVEKPSEAVAFGLLAEQALWNTLILAANAQALWNLASLYAAPVAHAFEHGYRPYLGASEAAARDRLARLYEELPVVDLSRDILERADGLRAVSMVDAGWSDCGTPERLSNLDCWRRGPIAGPGSRAPGRPALAA